ncbi:hypothetical protein [Bacillus sp. SM2101]|uniref:hypothetical protein n=1 Tax=Bacillus sp. SM2101 TaxID=2805366 RepID=UPI001BDEE03E|nr:hypothetical protein [Bacillus sp. SM2101]
MTTLNSKNVCVREKGVAVNVAGGKFLSGIVAITEWDFALITNVAKIKAPLHLVVVKMI